MRGEELSVFLNSKPLYYKEIDHKRVHTAYARLKPYIKRPETVHIVGTNGKGSTGRMIAYLAWRQGMKDGECGFSVGHYSSPHILKFNERIWMDGKDVSDEVLEEAHQKLFSLLGKEISDALSYFEYSTLLAFVVFENCDLMVLEAGLGGEYDATNVCDKELSVVTPIGIDHQAFLGDSIEAIAATKIQSIQKRVLLAPQIHPVVVEIAKEIAKEKGADLFFTSRSGCPHPDNNLNKKNTMLKDTNVAVGVPRPTVETLIEEKNWGSYLIDNAYTAINALSLLGIPYDINDLKSLELFGRFYALTDNIRIDVGHNPLAAKAIAEALDEKVVLVYNSLDDKDYEEVLQLLKPKVKRVEIMTIHSQRAATLKEIEKALEKTGLEYSCFDNQIDKNEQYLVFGSFYVVEAFLKTPGVRNLELVRGKE